MLWKWMIIITQINIDCVFFHYYAPSTKKLFPIYVIDTWMNEKEIYIFLISSHIMN